MNTSIDSYAVLYDLVNSDPEDHPLKNMAELLLSAMTDWPTEHVRIPDYVKKFKTYFGDPLTIEKIEVAKFNGSNAWNVEAGSSLRELINISSHYYKEDNFDAIVTKILDYYKTKTNKD